MTTDDRKLRGIFVTGTDTGVGKTLVAAALARALARRGLRVAVIKPVETGCALATDSETIYEGMSGTVDPEQLAAMQRLAAVAGPPPATHAATTPQRSLVPADALILRDAVSSQAPLDLINPFRYAPPLAPAVAARLADRPVRLDLILEAMHELQRDADLLIAEGAGGVLVPLTEDSLMVDLIARSGLAALLVGRSALGTINHCLLSLEALAHRAIPLCGVVLNRLTPEQPRPDEVANPVQIEHFAGDVIRGVLPYFDEKKRADLDYLADRIRVHLDLDALLRAARLEGPS